VPAKHNIRRAAHAALGSWEKGYDYAETLVERHAQRYQLSAPDRGLLNAIVFGVIRNRSLLDHFIGELRKGELDHDARDLLRIGLFQILFLNIADHAAVNETVDAAKSNVRGLINAVLRRSITQRVQLLEKVANLSVTLQLSHPEWLFKRWRKHYGLEQTISLMQWNQEPAQTVARYNTLSNESCPLENPIENAPGFFLLEAGIPHQLLRQGLIYIQDPATRHSIELLDPKPGEIILDACAAPGGKATMIAAAMKNQGKLIATDSNEKRLPRLVENLSNQQVTCAEIHQHDWLQPAPSKWHDHFDSILLDVPCSNTGVLRRRVDARWRLLPNHITDLTITQKTILENALPCLKKDGKIVYSTCSIEPEENLLLVKQFITEHPELSLEKYRQILPQTHNTDGAFAAVIKKV
jgi:16S rRNA (cytosine967-C5)-methyltransferase